MKSCHVTAQVTKVTIASRHEDKSLQGMEGLVLPSLEDADCKNEKE